MKTAEFEEVMQRQDFDRAETKRLSEAIARLSEDVATIHSSRHSAQENLARVVNEMRLDHNTLEKQVASLTNSIQELVIAMKGAYGGQGMVAQLEKLAIRIESMEATRHEGQGMTRLLGWAAAGLSVFAVIKSFTK
jgi:predicted translin family RNA/ssDNA-binding protein